MIEFLLPSLLAGLGIAIIAGPLGSFVVWRKMAYFGDTLAHASLLGIALGFLLHINLYLALIVTCIAIALFLVTLQEKSRVSTDTLLGILAHSALSLGLIAISFLDHVRVDLMSYLFGDLLAVNFTDVAFIYVGVLVVLLTLYQYWHPLLSSTVNEELAAIEGVNIKAMRLLIMVLTGVVIAVGMKFVGALIISSLLIIPAATAHKFSRSPEQMATIATLTGMLSVLGGLAMSWSYDTPAGPSVVCSALVLFIMAQLFARQRA
jgi:zinc transport system permease protein